MIKREAKIIIISHLGRPKGERNKNLSLTPIYKFLKEHLDTNIYFFMGEINEETKSKFAYLKDKEIILLENIRFFKGENKNDDSFAKLVSLGDIYINDVFLVHTENKLLFIKSQNILKSPMQDHF